jgi:hypothetical protein
VVTKVVKQEDVCQQLKCKWMCVMWDGLSFGSQPVSLGVLPAVLPLTALHFNSFLGSMSYFAPFQYANGAA